MKRNFIFRNNYNPSKYIDVMWYQCGHIYAAQFMEWEIGDRVVTNWNGNTRNKRRRRNISHRTYFDLIRDYHLVAADITK